MTRIRALAAVCLLLVLIGGAVFVAQGDNSRSEVQTSEQIAVPSVQAESVDVQILPEEHQPLRHQSVFFVVHVGELPENVDAFLLVFQSDSDTDEISYRFHHEGTIVVDWSMFFPGASESDVVVHVQDISGDTRVPVTASLGSDFGIDQRTIKVGMWTEDFAKVGATESRIDVRCTVECRIQLLLEWTDENLERIVAVLGLLIAFFGRKKIWASLRIPKARFAGTISRRREQRSREDRGPD